MRIATHRILNTVVYDSAVFAYIYMKINNYLRKYKSTFAKAAKLIFLFFFFRKWVRKRR